MLALLQGEEIWDTCNWNPQSPSCQGSCHKLPGFGAEFLESSSTVIASGLAHNNVETSTVVSRSSTKIDLQPHSMRHPDSYL